MNIKKEKQGFYAAILFLIWPLLAFASAFKNYREPWGKNIVWAFVAFYGFTFTIGTESAESDIVRYVAEVEYLHNVEMSPATALQYYRESGEIDVLRTLIAVILSRITDSQTVLTLVYGIIFGFFFSRNIWYVLDHLRGRLRPITIVLLICFALVQPFWNINGFRMGAATAIFVYGALPLLFEGKKKGIFISAASILVHFSFILPLGVLLGYFILGNRLAIYFTFFLATFLIADINLNVFNGLVENYTPEIVQERTSSYRSETNVELHRQDPEHTVWYAVWYYKALYLSVMAFLAVLYFKARDFLKNNKRWLSLYCFTLLFYGVVNLLNSLPSAGRFYDIATLLGLALIIFYIQRQQHEVVLKRCILAATPAILLFMVVALRIGLYSISAETILGNPVTAIFLMGQYFSLNDVMKMIL